ncbi:MAG: sigma-70 family RNA polymerase sigma factor, partial [Planctomycetaceae bacterium]|nr:sigma-70 family RNA polymerase sigma factor [Planctomycetaceae bacterium]
ELLEQALQQLDPELRSVFVLKEVESLSYREIAQVMDIPEGTVGSRLNRARRELQQHLADLGWEA